MAKKTIDDIQVNGKRVLVRCDFNVPMKDGKITNDKRIVAALPTIRKLIADGGKVILCSHLGKPKNGPEEKFSLAPVAVRLSELLGQPVVFANDDNVVGENAKAAVAAMKPGDVVLLQNTRFRKEETKNIEDFSKELASLAETYTEHLEKADLNDPMMEVMRESTELFLKEKGYDCNTLTGLKAAQKWLESAKIQEVFYNDEDPVDNDLDWFIGEARLTAMIRIVNAMIEKKLGQGNGME